MRPNDVPQGRIEVRRDGIEEVKEYVSFGRMMNIRRYMDTVISGKIRSGCELFTTVKSMLKAKLDKILPLYN